MNEDFTAIFTPWMDAEQCSKIVTLLECEEDYGE